MTVCLAPLLLLAAAAAAPPPEVLDRLDAGLRALAEPGRVVSYGATTEARWSAADGADPHVDLVESVLTPGPDGRFASRVVSHTRDGVPVAEEGRGRDGGGDLAAPAGRHLARYRYTDTRTEGGVCVADYAPAPGEPAARDLATGRVAWDPVAGVPLWIEYRPAGSSLLVQSLFVRVELACPAPDRCHGRRLLTRGVGGVPGFRKAFSLDIRFHDVAWR